MFCSLSCQVFASFLFFGVGCLASEQGNFFEAEGGEVLFKTDHEDYFIWVCEKMNASPLFTQAEWNAPFYPKTDFQKQWEAMGKPIFSARFIRNNA